MGCVFQAGRVFRCAYELTTCIISQVSGERISNRMFRAACQAEERKKLAPAVASALMQVAESYGNQPVTLTSPAWRYHGLFPQDPSADPRLQRSCQHDMFFLHLGVQAVAALAAPPAGTTGAFAGARLAALTLVQANTAVAHTEQPKFARDSIARFCCVPTKSR